MEYRDLGRTGIRVSEVGYGAWGIGGTMWMGTDDQESLRALHRAVDLGLNFIDTALGYGKGHSEQLVGKVVRERDEWIVVATKVPPKNKVWPAPAGLHPDETFPGEHIRSCTERSLQNLGAEVIDLQQLHVWSDEWLGQGDWLETVQALKDEGKIKAFGVSINDHQPENGLELVRSGVVDSVQVIYNVFDQSPEDELLPTCQERGVGVLARVPFDEGALTGRITPESTFPEGDFRNEYFGDGRKAEVDEHLRAILEDLGVDRDQLPEIALRYILSHPAVSSAIPGMRSVRNVERNCAVGDGKGLPPEQVEALKAHRWVRNFYR
ncbi:MAG: aldo/keto reductase [Actinomycetota bacterium]|nr:aldo/keto reductase [Actinomycetota bacterium]